MNYYAEPLLLARVQSVQQIYEFTNSDVARDATHTANISATLPLLRVRSMTAAEAIVHAAPPSCR